MVMMITDLPLELLLQIGWKLDKWEEIYGFTSVCRQLRKHLKYAEYAREKFKHHRDGHTTTRIHNRYRWRHVKMDLSSIWIYLPYGDNFNGKEYVLKLRMSRRQLEHGYRQGYWRLYYVLNQKEDDICTAFRDCSSKLKMYSVVEEAVKGRYDELFSEAVFKEMERGNKLIRYQNEMQHVPRSSSSTDSVGHRLSGYNEGKVFNRILERHNRKFCNKIVNPKNYRTQR